MMLRSTDYSSSFRRLRNGRPPLFRGLGKSRSKSEVQRKDCLNGNILTESSLDDRSNQSRPTPKLKTRMIKPFQQFLQKKNSSASMGDNNSLIDTYTPLHSESTDSTAHDTNDTAGMFGACGAMPIHPTSPQEDDRIQNLQKQLHELQSQVHDLNDELDHVYVEKEDAISKIDMMINVSKKTKNIVNHTELEEIRMMLTVEGAETTFTEDTTVRPFYKGFCGCA